MKKSKLFAPFLMLLAGAVTSIMLYRFEYTLKQTLAILIFVLLAFYLAGSFVQRKITSFVEQIREEEEKAGAVIEKESSLEGEDEMVIGKTENEAGNKA